MPKEKRRDSDTLVGKFKANAYSIVASITILGFLGTLIYNGYIAPKVEAQIMETVANTAHFDKTEGAVLVQQVSSMKDQLDHIETQVDALVNHMIRSQ